MDRPLNLVACCASPSSTFDNTARMFYSNPAPTLHRPASGGQPLIGHAAAA